MTREQKIAKASVLRAEGLTYSEIGERLGVTQSCVMRWLNPERTKEWVRTMNAKRGPAKRRWARENRADCPECGQPMQAGSRSPSHRPERCKDCEIGEARARITRFIAMRREGLTNIQIAELEGVTSAAVATTLCKAKRNGLEVPPSPYWSRAGV